MHSVLGLCVCRRALGGINWNLCLTVHCNFSRSDGSLCVTLALLSPSSRSHVCFRRRAFVARGKGRAAFDGYRAFSTTGNKN